MGNPAQDCPNAHATKVGGAWTWGTDESYGVLVLSDGRIQHRVKCNRCGQRSGPLPHDLVRSFGSPTPTWVERREEKQYEPCCVIGCAENGEDMHHFAPRNTFGTKAESWPILPLCRSHHIYWHREMDGYKWQQKSQHFDQRTDEVTT